MVDQEILQYTKEVRSLKAEEMRYRVVVDKVIEGKQLTSDERKFAKEFAAKYPDLEINKVILSTVERQENYKKIIEKANKGKELNAGELDFLINYYKDYPDVSVPKSVSKSLKNRKFENKISQSSLANLEESYGYAVKDYERYLNTGQYVYTKGGVTLQEAAYIYRVYNLKKSSGEDTLQERTDKKKMFANLRASDKKKIDSKTLAELSSEHIEFMTGRTSIEFDYIIGSDADKAKKDYEYYRFNELMKKQPIDWRDPDYMNKRNQYILKTGKNPSTGEKATKDEIFVAKNYGWVKGTTDVATATIDLLDNLGIFQLAMTKISRPKIDTSKIVKEINISDTATVPNTHTDVKIPKLKPAKTVDLEVPVKPKVDVKVPKIKPVEAVAGTTTMVPKSKKPDIDVLTKPKDLSTIKGEAVDHVGTVKPKVELDVPEVKDVHDVEAPKYNKEQILKNLEESKLARESSGFKDFSTRERYIEKVFNKLSPAERELIFNISKNAPKVEYRPGNTAKSVLSIPKNDRPNIEKVYSSEYIEAHRQQFENGAIKFQKFTPEEGGYNNGAIGNPKDHVAFVMPKEAGETLIKVTKGDPELLEDILGLHRGDLGSSPVAIEIPPESIKNLRIPSGNEDSAFDGFWKPGGQTFPGNMPEAVIDEVPWGEFTIRKLGGD